MTDDKIIDIQEEVRRRREQEMKNLGIFPPLTPDQTRVLGRLIAEPPEPEAVLTYDSKTIMTRGVVGALVAAGGTGKSFMVLQLGYALSRGGSLGPLKAAKRLNVLILAGEDPQSEVDRRLWRIGGHMFPEGLHAVSVLGQVGPLMEVDTSGNPQRAAGWHWLKETIENHKGLDVLILDPKSRFFGLPENDNNAATEWISCLENLSQTYDLTVVFTHHVSKARAETLNQAMSRGASALVDGCRWVAGIAPISEKTAKRLFVTNPRAMVEMDIVKSNYAALLPGTLFFKRGPGGILEYAALENERSEAISKSLYTALTESETRFSRRELMKKAGESIINMVKEDVPDLRKIIEINAAIDDLMGRGLLEEHAIRLSNRGGVKKTLEPLPEDPENPRHRFCI